MSSSIPPYVGRFAPSPSGLLHEGSLVAAMASFLDARAHAGRWLVRIEDLDTPRMVPGASHTILKQLAELGMHWDADPWYQSERLLVYQDAFETLRQKGVVYPCGCTRKEIADSVLRVQGHFPEGERPYPGTCRHGLAPGRKAMSWRLRVDPGVVRFEDRLLGPQSQDVAQSVGDFVIRRADGIWAYQLAVVVDDAAQGITDIVRGADLLGSSARQMVLAGLLGYHYPSVLHVPLVLGQDGQKLSKQNGAPSLDLSAPLALLKRGWLRLGFAEFEADRIDLFWSRATQIWGQAHGRANFRA